MHHFRRSKSLADISASRTELVRRLMNRKDPKALAATSTAIALSISSAFNDAGDPSSDSATGQGGDTGRQTAYAAVRMAVEIAEKSSDMFLPLKAAVGAVSALMKNYDVSASRS